MQDMKARLNPYGAPAPAGVDVVRVGQGQHTHVFNPETGMHLCNSGKNAGRGGPSGAVPTLYRSDANFVTCYRCAKLLGINARISRAQTNPPYHCKELPLRRQGIMCRDFGPGYSTEDRAAYVAWLKKCRELADDDEAYEAQGCKREGHIYTPYGRIKQRFPDNPTKGMSRPTMVKLAGSRPPFSHRTQSEKAYTYAVSSKVPGESPEKQIERAIAKYVGKGPAFIVPKSASSLIAAGFPEKAAHMLVQRAAGREFYIEREVKKVPSLLMHIVNQIGELDTIGHDVFLLREDAVLQEIRLGNASITRARIEQAHDAGDWTNIVDLFDAWLPSRLRWATTQKKPVLLTFRYVRGPKARQTFTLHVAPGEHSKSLARPHKVTPADYKDFRNVTLGELPSLLARLSGRKRRRGRRLAPR